MSVICNHIKECPVKPEDNGCEHAHKHGYNKHRCPASKCPEIGKVVKCVETEKEGK